MTSRLSLDGLGSPRGLTRAELTTATEVVGKWLHGQGIDRERVERAFSGGDWS